MEEKEIQIRQIVLLEEVSKRVNVIEGKVDSMYNDKLHTLDKGLGITQDKVSRMEKIIYGAITVMIAQAIGLIFLYLQRK